MRIVCKINGWLDDKLGLTKSDKEVANIKQNAQDRVSEVTKTLKKQGDLQRQVIKKTTTYYIGRATGAIK